VARRVLHEHERVQRVGTAFLGPQPFAMDHTAMLSGNPATIISTGKLTPSDDHAG
jgi:hypothetical protein